MNYNLFLLTSGKIEVIPFLIAKPNTSSISSFSSVALALAVVNVELDKILCNCIGSFR